ncbi:MAG: hypothetical protein AB1758_24850 [Candidatus Eremiobacterota bacterium]
MECPLPEGAPTLTDELRRGVNPFNLKVGVLSALALGALSYPAARAGWLPAVLPAWQQALAVTGLLFALVTLLHTAAHGFMGWLFERGLAAHCRGDLRRAAWLLAPAEWRGMDHYDPNGVALEALRDCRSRLPAEGTGRAGA